MRMTASARSSERAMSAETSSRWQACENARCSSSRQNARGRRAGCRPWRAARPTGEGCRRPRSRARGAPRSRRSGRRSLRAPALHARPTARTSARRRSSGRPGCAARRARPQPARAARGSRRGRAGRRSRRAHERAAARLDVDEPLALELHERLAHGRARAPEALRQRRGAQPLTGPELAREDRLSQLLGDAQGARGAGHDRRGGAQGVHTKSRSDPESNPTKRALCIQNAGYLRAFTCAGSESENPVNRHNLGTLPRWWC